MHLLIKLLSLITIAFYILVWGGCGNEEPPESQKTVTKKIIAKPPTPSKKDVVQESGTPPVPSKKVPFPTVVSKADQSEAMPDADKIVDQKKVPPPSDNKSVPPNVGADSKPPEELKDTYKPLIAKNEAPKPVLPQNTDSTKEEMTAKSPSGPADRPEPPKAPAKPKDTSIEKIAPETDTPQTPEKEDNAPSDLKPEASPSLSPETQDNQDEMHAPDIKAITSQVEEQLGSDKITSSYDPKGGIDPFVPFIKKAEPTKGPAPPPDRHRGPLEKVDIDQLQLVGIIRAPSGNLALVQQASGKGYIIQKGTPIGIQDGHVAEILANQVVVKEKGVDSHNEPITIERLMKIKKKIGEL